MNKHEEAKSNRPATPPTAATPVAADVIAHRRSCDAEGTGLTHFILVEEKRK